MGGSKNKSPAQKEKTQKKGAEEKKTGKPSKEKRVSVDTVNINESQAAKYIKNSKVITAYGFYTTRCNIIYKNSLNRSLCSNRHKGRSVNCSSVSINFTKSS